MKKTSFNFLLLAGWSLLVVKSWASAAPELVILGGRIVIGDADGTVREAMAVREGRILSVGNTAEISRLAGVGTEIIDLKGRTVLPGLYEAHVHALRASLAYGEPYQELRSIKEIQEWVRQRAREVPAGEWIRIPRNEITRLRELRHPTVEELDSACTTHPIVFEAVLKFVFNTRGFRVLGITDETKTIPGGEIILGANGKPHFLDKASPQLTSRFAGRRTTMTEDEKRAALVKLHQAYHSVGITTIFERGSGIHEYREYEKLKEAGLLSIRTRFTMMVSFRTAKDVESFVKKEKIKPGYGDDWLSIGTLKIRADGGIHWGNTYLSEPYGEKRAKFYVRSDPNYRGDFSYTDEQLKAVFGAMARMGWQMIVHVTGDGGVDKVLRALEAVNQEVPLKGKRFMLTHAYFPTTDHAARAGALGVGVDTQVYTFHLDAPFIHQIYGPAWADRFIGLKTWVKGGVPVIISSDHMVGYDPDHSMNSFNPFIQLYAAVSRRADDGREYGPAQKLSRIEVLRAMTAIPAFLNFEEDRSGTLKAGKFADFVVIDRDYLTCPEKEIRGIKVLRTVVGGKTVYQR
jgi:predicted amidohydrolase YtcJ